MVFIVSFRFLPQRTEKDSNTARFEFYLQISSGGTGSKLTVLFRVYHKIAITLQNTFMQKYDFLYNFLNN